MPTSVRLAPEAEARLDALARRTRRPKSYYVREAVESSLDRMEREYTLLSDVEDWRAGRMETVTLSEVERELGLDG